MKLEFDEQSPADGEDIHPPIIMLHGLFGSKSNFKAITSQKRISNGRRIFHVDLRNHGNSPHDAIMTYEAMAEDVLLLIQKQELRRPIIFGHSLGGKVAMATAMVEPATPGGLIIADIAPFTYKEHHAHTVSSSTIVRYLLEMPIIGVHTRKEVADEVQKVLPTLSPEIVQFLMTNFVPETNARDWWKWRCNLPVIKSYMVELGAWPFRQSWDGPCRFIKGEDSDYISDESKDSIHENFSNADIITMKDVGHWLHAENPYRFVDFLYSAIDKIQGDMRIAKAVE